MDRTFLPGNHNGIFLGLACNSPPPEEAIRLFDQPMLPVGTPELKNLPRPAMIVGSMPCERIASAVSSQDDLVYVAVLSRKEELHGCDDWVDDVVMCPANHDEICAVAERALERKRHHHLPKAIVSGSGFAWYGQFIELSALQAAILRRLVQAGGQVVGERELAFEIWGQYFDDPGRAVEAHIYRLRKRLQECQGVAIVTVRQRGFRLLLSKPKALEIWAS